MKFKDIESKSINELNDLLNDLKAESFALGWKNKTQQQDQTHKIRLVRRDIARVLTAIKQKELTAKKAPKKPKIKKAAQSTKAKIVNEKTIEIEKNNQEEGVK